MALKRFDYGNLLQSGPTEDNSYFAEIMPSILRNYYGPRKMANEEESQNHANKISGVQSEYAEPLARENLSQSKAKTFMADIDKQYAKQLKQAELAKELAHASYYNQRGQAAGTRDAARGGVGEGSRGAPGRMSTANRLLQEIDQAKEIYGPDSEEVKTLQGYLGKLSGTGVTGATRTKLQNSELANLSRKYLSERENPYMGTGSNKLLINDLAQYKKTKNPEEKEKLAEKLAIAAASVKIAPEYGGYQLASQGITPTVHALKAQEKTIKQGWPEFQRIVTNNMPKEILERGNKTHAKWLEDIYKIRSNSIERGFRPETGQNIEVHQPQQTQKSGLTAEQIKAILRQQ
jgi:hypothetical protein